MTGSCACPAVPNRNGGAELPAGGLRKAPERRGWRIRLRRSYTTHVATQCKPRGAPRHGRKTRCPAGRRGPVRRSATPPREEGAHHRPRSVPGTAQAAGGLALPRPGGEAWGRLHPQPQGMKRQGRRGRAEDAAKPASPEAPESGPSRGKEPRPAAQSPARPRWRNRATGRNRQECPVRQASSPSAAPASAPGRPKRENPPALSAFWDRATGNTLN